MTMPVWNGDILQALKWMHDAAPNTTSLITLKRDWYDKFNTQFWVDWQQFVFNLDTANNFGLMVWCIILGVPSQLFGLYPPDGAWAYGSDRQNFVGTGPAPYDSEGGNFYGGGEFTLLTAEEIRWALKLRYAALVSNGRIEYINRMLNWIFNKGEPWDYGSGKYVYVTDLTGAGAGSNPAGNIITNPQNLTNASWTKFNVTVPGPVAAPDGSNTAYKIVANNVSGYHYVTPPQSATASAVWTMSAFIKAAENPGLALWDPNVAGSGGGGVSFDAANKAILFNNITGSDARLEDVGNGWIRAIVTVPGNTATWRPRFANFNPSNPNAFSYVGNGVSGAYGWGMQLVPGADPGIYYPAGSIANPPPKFRLDYHFGPGMGMSPQFINLLNQTQYGILPSCAGSKTTVYQD